MIIIKFIYSKHSIEKMDGLGISNEDIEKAVNFGMKWKEIDNDKWHANMSSIECVFLKKEDVIFIITVYEN